MTQEHMQVGGELTDTQKQNILDLQKQLVDFINRAEQPELDSYISERNALLKRITERYGAELSKYSLYNLLILGRAQGNEPRFDFEGENSIEELLNKHLKPKSKK